MISIQVDSYVDKLINPVDMLGNFPEGTIFQQYSKGKPQKWFFIHCGLNEPSLVVIWYNDEMKKYMMSTTNLDELLEYYDHVKVKKINADLKIILEEKC